MLVLDYVFFFQQVVNVLFVFIVVVQYNLVEVELFFLDGIVELFEVVEFWIMVFELVEKYFYIKVYIVISKIYFFVFVCFEVMNKGFIVGIRILEGRFYIEFYVFGQVWYYVFYSKKDVVFDVFIDVLCGFND